MTNVKFLLKYIVVHDYFLLLYILLQYNKALLKWR